jgi:membrane protein implicated in regulation of membrane protease activity
MPSWIWAVIGLVLIAAELTHFAFFLIFIGIGALLTSGVTALGLIQSAEGQIVVFTVTSLLLIVLFRGRLKAKVQPPQMQAEYVGQKASVSQAIKPGLEGRVTYRGSDWIAVGEDGAAEIAEGAAVIIVGMNGVRLIVKPA